MHHLSTLDQEEFGDGPEALLSSFGRLSHVLLFGGEQLWLVVCVTYSGS